MTDLIAKHLALVKSYAALRNKIGKIITKEVSKNDRNFSHFEKALDVTTTSLWRKMRGLIGWSPEDIIIIIKQTSNDPKQIALVKAYKTFSGEFPTYLKVAMIKYKVKRGHFLKGLNMKSLSLYRRLKGEVQWEPDEIITVIKQIQKLEAARVKSSA